MTYAYNEAVRAKDLGDLREAVGWNRMESEYRKALPASYYHIAAYDGDTLVGYIDCVSNGVTDAYIQDLMVSPKHQGKGVGTELMNKMLAHLKEKRICMICVVFEERLRPFYEKFGFRAELLCGQMETYPAD